MYKKKPYPVILIISLFQALALVIYCGFVALIFSRGDKWFSADSWWGPLLFLILFVLSSLVSMLLTLGYPIFLIWEKGKTKTALRLIAYTIAWLALTVAAIIIFVVSTY